MSDVFRLLAAVAAITVLQAWPTRAWEAEEVTISSPLASKGPFTAQLLRPQGPGPFPAVVALHGCGGLLNKEDDLAKRETDWADRLVGAGYAVLFPDSFTARGMRQICTVSSFEATTRCFPSGLNRSVSVDAVAAPSVLARPEPSACHSRTV